MVCDIFHSMRTSSLKCSGYLNLACCAIKRASLRFLARFADPTSSNFTTLRLRAQLHKCSASYSSQMKFQKLYAEQKVVLIVQQIIVVLRSTFFAISDWSTKQIFELLQKHCWTCCVRGANPKTRIETAWVILTLLFTMLMNICQDCTSTLTPPLPSRLQFLVSKWTPKAHVTGDIQLTVSQIILGMHKSSHWQGMNDLHGDFTIIVSNARIRERWNLPVTAEMSDSDCVLIRLTITDSILGTGLGTGNIAPDNLQNEIQNSTLTQ